MTTEARQCEVSKPTNCPLPFVNTDGCPFNTRVKNKTHCTLKSGIMCSKPAPFEAVSQRNGLSNVSRRGVPPQPDASTEPCLKEFSPLAIAPTADTHDTKSTPPLFLSRRGTFAPFGNSVNDGSKDMSVGPVYRSMAVATPNRSHFVRANFDARQWHRFGPSGCDAFHSHPGLLSNVESVMPPQSRQQHHPMKAFNDYKKHQEPPMEVLLSHRSRRVGPSIPPSKVMSWVAPVPMAQRQVNANDSGDRNRLPHLSGRYQSYSQSSVTSASTLESNHVGWQNTSSMDRRSCRSHQAQKQNLPPVKSTSTNDYKKEMEMDAAAILCSFSKTSSEEEGVNEKNSFCKSDFLLRGSERSSHLVPYESFSSNCDISGVTTDSASSAPKNSLREAHHHTVNKTMPQPGFPTRLSTSSDESELNSLHCYVRDELLELFVIRDDDALAGRHSPTGPQSFDRDEEVANKAGGFPTHNCFFGGRVGFRCVHCAHLQPKLSLTHTSNDKAATPMLDPKAVIQNCNAPMGTFYPKSLSELYRLVCTWQRVHFHKCRHVPPAVRDHYHNLKQNDKSRGKTKHWVTSAVELGLMNDTRGGGCIRYFPGSTNGLSIQSHKSLS